ncbi:MAG TPA: haloacid dehalogenase type II [Jatrophihabitantaceae bacterium]|nr:haloacid dehalogenase type II [Jatrophihabitantaceae bacterium]
MSTRLRPRVVAFDVVETLASIDPVIDRAAQYGVDRAGMAAWFTRLLRDGMAFSAAGSYAGFAAVAASALTGHTRGMLTDEQVADVLAGFEELTPQPDAGAAVRAARDAGLRVLMLTNGAAATTRAFLDRAGLADAVEAVVSIDEVRVWKPHPAVYRRAAEDTGVPVERVALVAVHSWDVYGARQAGLTTGWCSRLETVPTPVFTATGGVADVVADTLDAVIAGLASLPEATTL